MVLAGEVASRFDGEECAGVVAVECPRGRHLGAERGPGADGCKQRSLWVAFGTGDDHYNSGSTSLTTQLRQRRCLYIAFD